MISRTRTAVSNTLVFGPNNFQFGKRLLMSLNIINNLENKNTRLLKPPFVRILLSVTVTYFFTFGRNVECVTPTEGKNYVIDTRAVSCPFSSELLSNVSCFVKRINRTSEFSSFDVYVKPGVQLNHVFVGKLWMIDKIIN